MPQASGRSLGDYLAAEVLGPAGLNATLYRSSASTGLAEGLVDNSGYVAVFNATAGQATPLYVPLSLNAAVAPSTDGGLLTDRFAELERGAGGCAVWRQQARAGLPAAAWGDSRTAPQP